MTIIPLTINNNLAPPFSTLFTLDGNQYNGAVTWNLYAQRWYLTLTGPNNALVWNGPLIGSPLTADIYLASGIFQTSTLLYREDTGNFEQNP